MAAISSAPLVVGNPLPNPSVPSFFSVADEHILSTASEKSIAAADMFSFRFGPIIARLPYSVEKSTSHEKPSDLRISAVRSCSHHRSPPDLVRSISVPWSHTAIWPFDLLTLARTTLQAKIWPLSTISSEAPELTGTNGRDNPIFRPELLVPGEAWRKRSRVAPCNWSSRLLVLSAMMSSSEGEIRKSVSKKKEPPGAGAGNGNSEGRKCLHCVTEKTPQWRTDPMGPKTLCTACGVRYKSDQLVSEYCPAASPTFILAKHSKSHRKVLKLW
ncbi:hypothetical protein ACLOJK_026066 [Asimina triloba]